MESLCSQFGDECGHIRRTTRQNSLLDGHVAVVSIPRIVELNPKDIARIEILKGTAEATMDGSKGANGVVIIRTRRGRGRPRE